MRAAPPRAAIALLVWGLLQTAACGGKTPTQPPPPPEQLRMGCPAPIVTEATTSQGAVVHFDLPSPTGGVPPYAVVCSPQSGAEFPIGATTVRCTASDAQMAQAACETTVQVLVSKSLGHTRFTAFGDSITVGVTSLAPFRTLGLPGAYPGQVEQMLIGRYPTQTVVVINQGVSGETTRRGAQRLPVVLDEDRPEVLLLLEGTNNARGTPTAAQAGYLESMIRDAQKSKVDVIIATVMPISPAREADPRYSGSMEKIQELNKRIFELAAQYRLGSPVDLFALFEAHMDLLGQDGLHPTAAGQTRIAEAFRDAIVQRYETPSAAP